MKWWQILKTITNHSKLKDIETIPENKMYFDLALKIKERLDELFETNYEYSIWFKNGRHDVGVNYNNVI